MKKNILIKLSGASISDLDEIISMDKLDVFSKQIKKISSKYGIGIVIGGGNIWRGVNSNKFSINRSQADSMGMLATIINGLALKASLENNGLKAEVYSSINVSKITNEHDVNKFNEDIQNNKIIIFTGGVGMPYFSTDTCAVLSALQIKSDLILMGKNGTDGLYDKDPNKYSDAKFIELISYDDVVNKKLRVADLTSITMANDNDIKIMIFNIDKKDSLINVLDKKGKFTIIKK